MSLSFNEASIIVRDTISSSAKSIVRHILEPDITLRLTLDRVITHEWVRARKERASSLIGRLVHSSHPVPSQQPIPSGRTVPPFHEEERDIVPGDHKKPESKKSNTAISVPVEEV
ncbi:hypothetical protein QE152_g8840 [Popillia japonica]|uniref:Uncharacterized protein n=1 Tax=Popillia japonica TaxID=7064 RepID=A0AAW1M2J9_POPJA